jgi:tetratricopeptide (TPR) repeat protein
MTCGIYQILNTVNGKSYVGHSRNIEQRWCQHTSGLKQLSAFEAISYPLKNDFIDHDLETNTIRVGRNGVFEFFIIEECSEDELLLREQFWLQKLQPTYNNWPITTVGQNRNEFESRSWVLYHNYEKLGHLPNEALLAKDTSTSIFDDSEILSFSTPKPVLKKGDVVYLIVGIGKRPKQYYLWSYLQIEEINLSENSENILYIILANGWLLDSPQFLNSPAFNSFKKACGNFSGGLSTIRHESICETFQSLVLDHRPENPKLLIQEYFERFYTQVISVNPQEAEVLCQQGLLYYKQGQDHRAITTFDQAIHLNSRLAKAYYYRGLAYDQIDDTKQAIENLQIAVQLFGKQNDQENLAAIAQETLTELQQPISVSIELGHLL